MKCSVKTYSEPESEVACTAKEAINGRGKRGADDRCASAMEGTSCADDMRLLHEIIQSIAKPGFPKTA